MTSTPRSPLPAPSGDVELLERLADARRDLLAQVGQRIVGQREVLDGILTAIFSGGHALLVGVPGLAKTMMVQTVAEALDLKFARIQFTPDLMPSDITGTEIIEEDLATGKRAFRFVRGDRKSTRLNSSHLVISYAVFCLKKKKRNVHSYKQRYHMS